MISPCKKCDKRKVGCHDSCKDYKAFTVKAKEIAKKEREDSMYYGTIAEKLWSQH